MVPNLSWQMAEGAHPLFRAWSSLALCGLYETLRKMSVSMKNSDQRTQVEELKAQGLTPKAAYDAVKLKHRISRLPNFTVDCPDCAGSGEVTPDERPGVVVCERCKGKGEVLEYTLKGEFSLDEWCDKFAPGLREDIKLHMENCEPEDVDRYIMISVRQWFQDMWWR
jgi:RecJ-like exonuclease